MFLRILQKSDYFGISSDSVFLSLGLFVVFILLREFLLRQSAKKPIIYYLILFPGIIIHELSHTLACLLTFTKVRDIKLFSKTGGFVIHEKPSFLLIGFVISAAPIISGSIIMYLFFRFISSSPQSSIGITGLFLLYFSSSVLITMLPSKEDILNAFSVYLALVIAGVSYYLLAQDHLIFAKINIGLFFSAAILLLFNAMMLLLNKLFFIKK